MDEFEIIETYFAPLTGGAVGAGAFALRDDVGLLSPYPHGLDRIVTTDMLVAGVHFFADDDPADIAWKALAVNVSDVVAKGGTPSEYLLSVALPDAVDADWLKNFSEGLLRAQDHYRCALVGGDTVRTTGPLSLSITLTGIVPSGELVRREGAKSGDLVYVGGPIGDAALGLLLRLDDQRVATALLSPQQREALLAAYLRPQPSFALGQLLRPVASASMDVSDGLAGDFAKLCKASLVGGVIEATAVPLSPAATALVVQDPTLLETVLTGGDDYRPLFTISPERAEALEQAASARGELIARIGRIADRSEGVRIIGSNGETWSFAAASYNHFAK